MWNLFILETLWNDEGPLNILWKLFFFFSPDPSGDLIIVDEVTNKMGKDKDNLEFHYLFCSVVVKKI